MNDTSCVITDLHMPDMSGIELQRRLITQGHRTPIIFITAFYDDNIRARAMKAGATCFLSKPFDGQTLIECLDAARRSVMADRHFAVHCSTVPRGGTRPKPRYRSLKPIGQSRDPKLYGAGRCQPTKLIIKQTTTDMDGGNRKLTDSNVTGGSHVDGFTAYE